jgi:Flp pilus assembly protein TadG
MPWWSWILIWIALVALSLLFFGVLGVRLYRQFMTALNELTDAADRLSLASSRSGTAGSETDDAGAGATGEAPRSLPGDAVFASPSLMRHHYHASKISRQNARRLRRIQRRKDRGQPQALRDIELG